MIGRGRHRAALLTAWIVIAGPGPASRAALPEPSAPPLSDEPVSGKPVSGKFVVKGKTLTLTRVWLVRGADNFDKSKPSAYLILSSEDLSAAIAACKDLSCVLWDTVKNGVVLQPVEDGHQSFWLRVVVPELPGEYQISGRQWNSSVDQRDRLAGRLQFSYANTGEEADLTIDAPLAREFPLSPPATPVVPSTKKRAGNGK